MNNLLSRYHDLENFPDLKLAFRKVREAYRLAHPNASRTAMTKAIVERLFADFPEEARDATSSKRRATRRLGQLELAKSRTHGFEWNGELTGGNFGASF